MHKVISYVACFFFLTHFALSQDVKGIIVSSEKHVEVGKPIPVTMEITHPDSVMVIFPDSAEGFKPWELKSKKPSETVTKGKSSLDKANFEVLSWEIDSIQHLKLPFRYILGKDTLVDSTNSLSFHFIEKVSVMPDSLEVRRNEDIIEIQPKFNFRAFLILGSSALLIILVLIVLLRKPLKKWIRRNRIEREWKKVLAELLLAEKLTEDHKKFAERINRVWKNYFSSGETELSALSTRELKEALQNLPSPGDNEKNFLISTSHAADMILFAGGQIDSSQISTIVKTVKEIMEKEHRRRLQEVTA